MAAAEGHVEVVKSLIAGNAGVNVTGQYNVSALHNAARRGCTKVINALLTAGAKINARDECGDTPLHDAAEQGHVEAINILLASGSKVDQPNILGRHLYVKLQNLKRSRQLMFLSLRVLT